MSEPPTEPGHPEPTAPTATPRADADPVHETRASGLLRAYQVLATVVGVNLIFVVTAAVAQRVTDPVSWWNRNQQLILVVDQVHGFLFMVLLVLIAVLARRHRWQPGFVIATMLLATIPFVSFWAERRASRAALTPAPAQDAGLPG